MCSCVSQYTAKHLKNCSVTQKLAKILSLSVKTINPFLLLMKTGFFPSVNYVNYGYVSLYYLKFKRASENVF